MLHIQQVHPVCALPARQAPQEGDSEGEFVSILAETAVLDVANDPDATVLLAKVDDVPDGSAPAPDAGALEHDSSTWPQPDSVACLWPIPPTPAKPATGAEVPISSSLSASPLPDRGDGQSTSLESAAATTGARHTFSHTREPEIRADQRLGAMVRPKEAATPDTTTEATRTPQASMQPPEEGYTFSALSKPVSSHQPDKPPSTDPSVRANPTLPSTLTSTQLDVSRNAPSTPPATQAGAPPVTQAATQVPLPPAPAPTLPQSVSPPHPQAFQPLAMHQSLAMPTQLPPPAEPSDTGFPTAYTPPTSADPRETPTARPVSLTDLAATDTPRPPAQPPAPDAPLLPPNADSTTSKTVSNPAENAPIRAQTPPLHSRPTSRPISSASPPPCRTGRSP